MRVITGTARGKALETLAGEDIIRPTSQKVKEALFSAIQFYVPGAHVLDLFAGSGQLGIEALSRDAVRCVFVDANRASVDVIIRNLKNTKLFQKSRVVTSDAGKYLQYCKDKFDIVFMDPPYKDEAAQDLIELVDRVCAPGALVAFETDMKKEPAETVGSLRLRKCYRYGRTYIWLYQKPDEEGEAEA